MATLGQYPANRTLTSDLIARLNVIMDDLSADPARIPPLQSRKTNTLEQSLPESGAIDGELNEEYSPPSSIASSPCSSPGNVAAPLPSDDVSNTVPGKNIHARIGSDSTSRPTHVRVEQELAQKAETKTPSVVSSKPPTEVSSISYSRDSQDGRSGISDPSTVIGDIAAVVTSSGLQQIYKERLKQPTPIKRLLPLPPVSGDPMGNRTLKASRPNDEFRRLPLEPKERPRDLPPFISPPSKQSVPLPSTPLDPSVIGGIEGPYPGGEIHRSYPLLGSMEQPKVLPPRRQPPPRPSNPVIREVNTSYPVVGEMRNPSLLIDYEERPQHPAPSKTPLPLSPTPLDLSVIRAIKASHHGEELRRLSPSRARNGKVRINALSQDEDGYETADEVRSWRARRA